MSFFRRKVRGRGTRSQQTPGKLKSLDRLRCLAILLQHQDIPHREGTRNHALLEAAGPSHVAINAISANMESCSSRTAALKKQPSHMEAAHFGDLGRSCLDYQAQESKVKLV